MRQSIGYVSSRHVIPQLKYEETLLLVPVVAQQTSLCRVYCFIMYSEDKRPRGFQQDNGRSLASCNK